MRNQILINLLVLFVCFQYTNSQIVTNQEELNTAISNASEGAIITLANGTWSSIYLDINKSGTNSKPIKILAQTPGKVFFEGNSRVSIGGSYINLEGVIFRNPSNLQTKDGYVNPIIEFRSSDKTSCTNCIVRNIKIDSYNGTKDQELTIFKWIILYGQYNEISYSSFVGKHGVGSIINDNRNTPQENYTKIHHNYFADRTFVGTYVDEYNDQDAMRIGNSKTSLSNSFTQVYDNLFSNFFGEIEVISNKSCSNKYYNNTFRNYSGALSLRHGNNNEAFNNYFFAEKNTFSGGIRVMGENAKVYNNYIEGVNSKESEAHGGGTTSNLGGINLMGGEVGSENGQILNGYYQVKNAQIVNNTFVNCDYGIRIGGGGGSKHTLAPENLMVANNIFLMPTSSGQAVNQILSAEETFPYTFNGNIRQSGTWTLNGNTNSNQVVTSNLLSSSSQFYRLTKESAAIGSAVGNYSFLTNDILGGSRLTTGFDAGSEEFGSTGKHFPYNDSDVGVKLGFQAYQKTVNLEVSSNQTSTGNITCNNLIVDSDKTFTIKSGHTLSVYGNLTATGHLIIQPGASLITFDENLITGNIIIQRAPITIQGATYIGTPVIKNDKITTDTLGTRILIYNESTEKQWSYTSPEILIPGKGYFPLQPKELFISFSGIPNKGTITLVELAKTPGTIASGLQLISNPYAAAIDADAFIKENKAVLADGLIYLLDSDDEIWLIGYDGQVSVKGFDGKIASSQGFFVKVNKDNSTIVFTEDMRVSPDDTFTESVSDSDKESEYTISASVLSTESLVNSNKPFYKYENGKLSVTVNRAIEFATVTIYDMLGKVVYEKRQLPVDGLFSIGIEKKGVHIVKITTNKDVYIKKILF